MANGDVNVASNLILDGRVSTTTSQSQAQSTAASTATAEHALGRSKPGTRLRITGLHSKPELNGREAVLEYFDQATQRYRPFFELTE